MWHMVVGPVLAVVVGAFGKPPAAATVNVAWSAKERVAMFSLNPQHKTKVSEIVSAHLYEQVGTDVVPPCRYRAPPELVEE
ncbi:Uncharacterised protein [Nocardia asteroides]|nr:hypothetical protein SAMN05444423_11545 [Nocardia asteroides]VEG36392.1 Uncharacterised protein [Nocardia asteroides]